MRKIHCDENNSSILLGWYPWSDTTETATEQLCYNPDDSDFGGWKVQDGGCCTYIKQSLYKVKTASLIQDDHECLWYCILYRLGGNVSMFSLEMLILFTWFLSYSFSNFQRAEGVQDEYKSMQNSAQIFLSNKPVDVIIRKLSSSVSQIPRRVGLCSDLKH